jgi:hypothetical protein
VYTQTTACTSKAKRHSQNNNVTCITTALYTSTSHAHQLCKIHLLLQNKALRFYSPWTQRGLSANIHSDSLHGMKQTITNIIITRQLSAPIFPHFTPSCVGATTRTKLPAERTSDMRTDNSEIEFKIHTPERIYHLHSYPTSAWLWLGKQHCTTPSAGQPRRDEASTKYRIKVTTPGS